VRDHGGSLSDAVTRGVNNDGRHRVDGRRFGGEVPVVQERPRPCRSTPEVDRRADTEQDGYGERDPGEVVEPPRCRPARVVDHKRGAEGPDNAAGRVGQQKLAIRHAKRAGEGAGKDAQQGHKAAEEDGPNPPAFEDPVRPGEVLWAEMFGKPPPEPHEERPPAAASDGVPD
jgi:hypothetical protein